MTGELRKWSSQLTNDGGVDCFVGPNLRWHDGGVGAAAHLARYRHCLWTRTFAERVQCQLPAMLNLRTTLVRPPS